MVDEKQIWELDFVKGSEEAFEWLSGRAWPVICAEALRMRCCLGQVHAEDMALAALVRAWQRRAEFPARGLTFDRWVCGLLEWVDFRPA
jgi:hypothetical protein